VSFWIDYIQTNCTGGLYIVTVCVFVLSILFWFPQRLYIHQSTRTCQKTCLSVFPYIFQAKYIRNKKINENKLVGGTTTWGTIWGSCLRAPVKIKPNSVRIRSSSWAVKFSFFPRRDLNSHHWYTAAPIA
jgi:hypothetical protein